MNCVYSATGDYVCTPPTAISEKFQNSDNCGPQNGPRTKDCCDDACYQKIWKNAGCTTPKQHDDWSVTQTKESLTQDSNAWGVLTDDAHRNKCYGTDRTKWPGYVAPKSQDQVMQTQRKKERKTRNQQIEAPQMEPQMQQMQPQMQQMEPQMQTMEPQMQNQMQDQPMQDQPIQGQNELFDQHGYQNESFDQYQPYTQNSSY